MYRNELYVGSIRDNDDIWHPVVVSPDEDFVQRCCQGIIDNNKNFYMDEYTIELIPVVIKDEEMEWITIENRDTDSFFNDNNWIKDDESSIYEDIISIDPQNGQEL